MAVEYTGIEVAAVSPMSMTICEDIHLSRSMNHMYALEADHKLDSPYPHGPLSEKRCNISLMDS